MPVAVVNRYARALADVVAGEGDYAKVAREVADFAQVLASSRELREFFDSPALSMPKKKAVLDEILKRLDSSKTSRNFFHVLVDHFRVNLLEDIRAAYQDLVNERLGVARVKVTAAAPLAEFQRTALQERFGELTGLQVQLDYVEDSSILGGLVTQVGSTVYDGSVKGQLERLRERLRGR